MSIRTIVFASVLACLGAVAGQESAALAQPVMPPPPSPTYVPPAPPAQGHPAPAQPAESYPAPAQAYPPPQQQPAPAYPPPQQQPAPVYPPPQQPAPVQQQPAPAYPPPQQPASSYPPPQQPASSYPQPGQGYPPPQSYPPPQQPQGYPPPQQPQGYPPPQQGYPPPQVDAAPPPPAPAAKKESVFANPLSKLQVGFHLGMGSLTTDKTSTGADYSSDLTSLAIFVRYRFNQRWEAELAVASESGTVKANDAVRDFTPITASGLFHVIDLRGVDVYGRAGLGRATEVYDNPAFKPLEGSTTHFHIGAGASYTFRRNIAAGVEMRWNRISRSSNDDLSSLVGSGTVYSAYGAYHF